MISGIPPRPQSAFRVDRQAVIVPCSNLGYILCEVDLLRLVVVTERTTAQCTLDTASASVLSSKYSTSHWNAVKKLYLRSVSEGQNGCVVCAPQTTKKSVSPPMTAKHAAHILLTACSMGLITTEFLPQLQTGLKRYRARNTCDPGVASK